MTFKPSLRKVRLPQTFLCLFFLSHFLLISCERSGIDNSFSTQAVQSNKNAVFDGSEGDPIALELASEWTQNYQEAHPEDIAAHFVGKDILVDLLDQSGAMGIRIHRGLDEGGQRAVLLMAADASGSDLQSLVADFALPCPELCDQSRSELLHRSVGPAASIKLNGSEGDPIQLSKAKGWIDAYRNAHPQGIWGHFFGEAILKDILKQPTAVGLRIYYAIDQTGTDKVVLVGVDSDGNDLTGGLLADFSDPCPNTC